MEEAKIKRRTAKAALTRQGKALRKKLSDHRPISETSEALKSVKAAFEDLVVKHEAYTQLIVEDEAFEQEEAWLEECQDFFLEIEMQAVDYANLATNNGKSNVENGSVAPPAEQIAMLSKGNVEEIQDSALTNGAAAENFGEGPNMETALAQESVHVSGNGHSIGANNPVSSASTSCGFKMEKPKMPRFAGDVREYAIFRSDFRHAVDSRFSKRDAISLLRTSLQGKALELIKGIGTDYDAAWSYLDSVYGDPRFVADTVTQDISKFRPLREGEDARFCDLVHLVQRSFNTLKEIGRPHDMDNNHMLALIEQRMCNDDRKVWARHLENSRQEATLAQLITWMTTEMKSRMRATAPLRSVTQPPKLPVSHVGGTETKAPRVYRCWFCQNSNHWIDQCQKFTSLKPEDRIKAVKENHACFSCLKRAGRDHRSVNCSRRRQCPEKSNGIQCTFFHHPLLHGAMQPAVATVSALTSSQRALLPIVQVDIVGTGRVTRKANALLDSGAQISLIRSSLAEDLKLRGKSVVVTITKVGGEEEELMTMMYRVQLRSLENRSAHVIDAIGIPSISDDVAQVEITDIAKKLGLNRHQLHLGHGQTDLLIGIDQAKLHTGETRKFDNLIARHSPLGWVVFGAIPGQSASTHVYHIKLEAPVDLAAFWSTESMGVVVKACTSEAEKLSQVE